MKGPPIIIGVDESGTGSFAGSYTICAMAFHKSDIPYLRQLGVRDSKKLNDKKRRKLVPEIVAVALCGSIHVVDVKSIDQLKRAAWVTGVVDSVNKVLEVLESWVTLDNVEVVVDGNSVPSVQRRISVPLRFMTKADQRLAAVGAASILAKTRRNDLMIELHGIYPEYFWNRNAGYGTKDHLEALHVHGKTEYHRNIAPLKQIRERNNGSKEECREGKGHEGKQGQGSPLQSRRASFRSANQGAASQGDRKA